MGYDRTINLAVCMMRTVTDFDTTQVRCIRSY